MSKSLNNGIDPIKVCDDYGIDVLRYAMANSGTPGLDCNIGPKIYEQISTYLNKVWSAARLILSLLPDGFEPKKLEKKELGFIEDRKSTRLNSSHIH